MRQHVAGIFSAKRSINKRRESFELMTWRATHDGIALLLLRSGSSRANLWHTMIRLSAACRKTLRQAHDRHGPRSDDIAQNLPGAHRRQLPGPRFGFL
jgi:hypothetical protein